MSEYHQVKVEFRDKKCLIKALKDLGYNPQVHDEATNLYGYKGDKREQKCHIIVPRNQVGSASNDLGFERQDDGTYLMHISQYDEGYLRSKIPELKKAYSENVVMEEISSNIKYTDVLERRVEKDGTIYLRVGVNG